MRRTRRRRKVYNGMIDRKPRLIAKCTDVADVMAAVRMAKANGLRVSIRGGGHNAAGLGVCDDGMVIDLAPINYVRVDPSSRTVLVGAGCKWSDVDHATHAFGLAVPSGIISSTGVAGLTLGGGMGHLTRKYGLTIDNLLSVDMVLADGSFVVASAEENTDLFWAVRGGGGNFGIVTSFLFEAHPVAYRLRRPDALESGRRGGRDEVVPGVHHAGARRNERLLRHDDRAAGAALPRGVASAQDVRDRVVLSGFDGAGEYDSGTDSQLPSAGFRILRADAVSDAAGNVRRRFTPPVCNGTGRPISSRNSAIAAIEKHLEHASLLPTWQSTMHLYPVNGKVNRVGETDTAFSYRDAVWSEVIVGVDPDPANREKITDWARAYYDALHPFGAGGAYLNFMMEEGEDRIRATYRGNYDRLAAIKAKYDPGNFFRVNQNIRPAA